MMLFRTIFGTCDKYYESVANRTLVCEEKTNYTALTSVDYPTNT